MSIWCEDACEIHDLLKISPAMSVPLTHLNTRLLLDVISDCPQITRDCEALVRNTNTPRGRRKAHHTYLMNMSLGFEQAPTNH